MTAGSRTTPSTVPVVRQGCAAARQLLANAAAGEWGVAADQVKVSDGAARDAAGQRTFTYADLAKHAAAADAFKADVPKDVELTPIAQWKTMGTSVPRPNGRDLVTGKHQYPSDIVRPGMLYAKVLRPPGCGATLSDIDLAPAKAMKGVAVARDGNYVAVAAPTTHAAKQAIAAIEPSAKWETRPHPSSRELFDHFRRHAKGGVPANPYASELNDLGKHHKATYEVAYVQHAPLEPRAAVAEWDGDKVTVWTATQRPTGVRKEVADAFHMSEDRVRLIVPDFGGGFGGKHTGECAVECARIAKAAGKPVALRWTRAEEFTWAVFRPAALIDIEATTDAAGKLTSWHYVNVNSGRAGIDTPYKCGRDNIQFVETDAPLRHGSYRALAATANAFARESFIDELARAAGRDPLEYRLAQLPDPRIRAVLEEAAKRFNWSERGRAKSDGVVGVGLACGTEKGSVVAACVEVEVDRAKGDIRIRKVCQAYECGKIINPDNLRAQVEGGIIQAIGPALREATEFENGAVTNGSFWKYEVPRLADVPQLDIHLLDRPDLPSVGAGETPLIALAPAVANAVFHATGVRVRTMPIKLPADARPSR
jgi:CO/xanthine dehydrogenase Mo-binding subunit